MTSGLKDFITVGNLGEYMNLQKEDDKMTKKSTIKDIYNGKIISCWEDDRIVWLCFPFCDVKFLKEDWEDVKKELRELTKR